MVRGEGDGSWLQEKLLFPLLREALRTARWDLDPPRSPRRRWEMGTWSAGLGRAVGRREPECHVKDHSGKVT